MTSLPRISEIFAFCFPSPLTPTATTTGSEMASGPSRVSCSPWGCVLFNQVVSAIFQSEFDHSTGIYVTAVLSSKAVLTLQTNRSRDGYHIQELKLSGQSLGVFMIDTQYIRPQETYTKRLCLKSALTSFGTRESNKLRATRNTRRTAGIDPSPISNRLEHTP